MLNPNTRETAAYHEAAHAVVGIKSGLSLSAVMISVDPSTGIWGGVATFDLPQNWLTLGWISTDENERERIRDAMATAYAGSVLERELTGHDPPYFRWQQDSTFAQLLTGRLSDSLEGQMEERENSKRRAAALIEQHRQQIDNLAQRLIDSNCLTGEEVTEHLDPPENDSR